MSLKVLVVIPLIYSLSAYAIAPKGGGGGRFVGSGGGRWVGSDVRDPKVEKGIEAGKAEVKAQASKLVVGEYNKLLETRAKDAAVNASQAGFVADVMRYNMEGVITTAIGLGDGSALFAVDVKWSYQKRESATKRAQYAVHVKENGKAAVTGLVAAESILDLAKQAVWAELGADMFVPGRWPGGAPRVMTIRVRASIGTGEDSGVVVIEMQTEQASLGNPTIQTTVTIEDGKAVAVSEYTVKREEPSEEVVPLTQEYAAWLAQQAAVDFAKKNYAADNSTAKTGRILGSTDGYLFSVEVRYGWSKGSFARPPETVIVQVNHDGTTQVFANPQFGTFGPPIVNGEPQGSVRVNPPAPKIDLKKLNLVDMSKVAEEAIRNEIESSRKVKIVKVEIEPVEGVGARPASFSATVTVDLGRAGQKVEFYNLILMPNGKFFVRSVGAQG